MKANVLHGCAIADLSPEFLYVLPANLANTSHDWSS